MSIVKRIRENPPKEPCLLLLTGPEEVGILGRGTVIIAVEDPSRDDRVVPMQLLSVGVGVIRFQCACDKPGCNRQLTYRRTAKGRHPGRG